MISKKRENYIFTIFTKQLKMKINPNKKDKSKEIKRLSVNTYPKYKTYSV